MVGHQHGWLCGLTGEWTTTGSPRLGAEPHAWEGNAKSPGEVRTGVAPGKNPVKTRIRLEIIRKFKFLIAALVQLVFSVSLLIGES